MTKLSLPSVTLCAATSIHVQPTIAAIRESLRHVDVGDAILFTDAEVDATAEAFRVVRIPAIASSQAYSDFILRDLVHHVRTDHCLITQWDGFVINADAWDPAFSAVDYIGAPWPQFDDGHDVGNGGFSLRSRRLMEACLDPRFEGGMAEDIAIGRANRDLLEREHGIRFATRELAERFSFERGQPTGPTFGFHGIFNLIPLIGTDRFWTLYEGLDGPGTAMRDFGILMRQLKSGPGASRRRLRLTVDRLKYAISPRRA